MHIGLADDDGTGRAQLCGHRRVLARHETLQRRRSRARGQPGHFDVVLDDDGHAAERLARALLAAGVERVGSLHRACFIERDEGIEVRFRLGAGQCR